MNICFIRKRRHTRKVIVRTGWNGYFIVDKMYLTRFSSANMVSNGTNVAHTQIDTSIQADNPVALDTINT